MVTPGGGDCSGGQVENGHSGNHAAPDNVAAQAGAISLSGEIHSVKDVERYVDLQRSTTLFRVFTTNTEAGTSTEFARYLHSIINFREAGWAVLCHFLVLD
jgi:hypothetical protein